MGGALSDASGGGVTNSRHPHRRVSAPSWNSTFRYFGGGVSNRTGTLTVTNSTISGNSAHVWRRRVRTYGTAHRDQQHHLGQFRQLWRRRRAQLTTAPSP